MKQKASLEKVNVVKVSFILERLVFILKKHPRRVRFKLNSAPLDYFMSPFTCPLQEMEQLQETYRQLMKERQEPLNNL